MMAILTTFGPLIAQLAMWLLGGVIGGVKSNEKAKVLFDQLASELRTQGLKRVKSRFEAEDQLAAGDAAWDERSKPKEPTT